MAFYSLDEVAYRHRVYANGRTEDQEFSGDEFLYRRILEIDLVKGEPWAASLNFRPDTGHSVNRAKYSHPCDVLEPDCCGGKDRSACAVLQFEVGDTPDCIPGANGAKYYFRPKHAPRESCYPHSEIWCTLDGDITKPYHEPPKVVKNIFRAELARAILRREILRYERLDGDASVLAGGGS